MAPTVDPHIEPNHAGVMCNGTVSGEHPEGMEFLKETPKNVRDGTEESQDKSKPTLEDDKASGDWIDMIGNGQLMKRTIKKGVVDVVPLSGDICTLNVEGRLETNSLVVEKHNNLKIFAGAFDIIQGLDLLILLMAVGEVAEIKIHPRFGYGTLGKPDLIPPNSTLIYTVELLTVTDFDITQVSLSERKTLCLKKRLSGNWWFNRNESSIALECYKKALAFLAMDNLPNEELPNNRDLEELSSLTLTVRNNMAVTQLKLGLLDEALESANYVLSHEPENIKALHRKAKILTEKGEFDEAYDVYVVLMKIFPLTKAMQKEMTALLGTKTKNVKKEKNLYRKMLGMRKMTDPENISSIKKDENKNERSKKVIWSLAGGASIIIFSILLHKFVL